MTDKPLILLVDDDAMVQEIQKHQLGAENYRYNTASNGLDALVKIQEDKPQVVLLDVNMPDMDGLETCRRLRAQPATQDIQVIFVTSQDDAATRQAAFEAGGDDVLVKPTNPKEIRLKVETALAHIKQVRDLQGEVASTLGALLSTITTSGQYGMVMNFFRGSFACHNMGELTDVMLKALDDFGLNGSVQLRLGENIITMNSERRSSPLEQEMLHKLSLENRHIYDYGNRTAFCYPNVAVLIKNMPLDRPEDYGRIKDNIALLAEGAEFRLKALADEVRMRQQRETLAASAALASQVLTRVDSQFKTGQSEMADIFAQLEQKLEWAFAGLGLSEGQERGLWDIVRPLSARATNLYDAGLQLDSQLQGALESLRLSLQEGGDMGDQDIWL